MTKNGMLLGLAGSGLLFSGYLSGVKLFTDTCAFNESCPFFLGYPACYFGFVTYLVMATLLLLKRSGVLQERTMLRSILGVSALGILFAGSFTVNELPRFTTEGMGAYFLGLPTCAYGLLVYLALFGVTIAALLEKESLGDVPRV